MAKALASLELENLKLRKENEALNETVSKLCKEINKLRNIETPTVTKLFLSPEEHICALQIQQLRAISDERKLTLEEVKTLDLLIKNKRLLENKSTSKSEFDLPPNMSDDELLRIAESVEVKKEITSNEPDSGTE
jgi:hypothetical protein